MFLNKTSTEEEKKARITAIQILHLFLDMSTTTTSNSQAKRKEIYKYEAPWMVYAMNWSIRPDKRFRLALGSFVEEYNNKVNANHVLQIHHCTSHFRYKSFH